MLTTSKRIQIDSFCFRGASQICRRSAWIRIVPEPSFFPFRFMARALRPWAINRGGKNSVRNLRYGPQARLVKGMHCIALRCVALRCVVLYCIVLYSLTRKLWFDFIYDNLIQRFNLKMTIIPSCDMYKNPVLLSYLWLFLGRQFTIQNITMMFVLKR